MNPKLSHSASLGVSALAPFTLLTLWGSQQLAHGLVIVGLWSEELFRGDRLPALPFPTTKLEGDESRLDYRQASPQTSMDKVSP